MTTSGGPVARSSARRPGRRLLGLLAAGGLGLAPLVVPPPSTAAAAAVVAAPVAASGVTTATAPASGVSVDLEQVQPTALVPGSDLVVRVRVVNGTATSLDGARVRLFVNSPALTDRAQVTAWEAGEGVQGGDRFVGVDGSELPLDVDLAPGASTEMTFTVDADQLRLGDQFGARGITVDVLDASLQRLDALRSFVVWVPAGAPPASAGLTVLAPVVAGPPDTSTGQLPEDLIDAQVAPDGRLTRVLASLTTPATSLVVDPAVLGPYARSAEDPTGAGSTASPTAGQTASPAPTTTASSSPSGSPSSSPGATSSPGTLVLGTDGDESADAQSWRLKLSALSPGALAVLPRGDVDVSGVIAAATSDLLPLALAQGAASASTATGAPPATGLVWPLAPVPTSQVVLAAAGAAQDGSAPAVVLDSTAVAGAVSAQGTAPSSLDVTATGSDGATSAPVRALLVDSTDSALLASATRRTTSGSDGSTGTTASDPAEVGARLLADTAVAATTGAASGQGQGLVLALPRDWDPDPVAASTVLSPLGSAPWVRSTPLADLLAADATTPVEVTGDSVTPAAAQEASVLPADGLATAQRAVDQARRAGALVADPTDLEDPVEAGAVAAASAGWVGQQDAWRTQLSLLAQRGDQLQAAVAVVPGSQIFAVNRNVDLPVTVRNDLSQSATVWVSVQSRSLRLQPGRAQRVVIPAGSTQTVAMPVKAVASGDLSLGVLLTDEAGQAVGEPTRLQVRVRADWENRGIAIAVAVVALVFVGGVARTVVRVRRRGAPPVVRSAEEADGDGPPVRRPEESSRG